MVDMRIVLLILVIGIHVVHSEDILIGLFSPTPVSGEVEDPVELAMLMAIQDLNSNTSILPNYTINYLLNTSACDAQQAMSGSVWQLTNHPDIVAIVGADCTAETQSIALLAGVYSVPTISYASTYIGLSDANGQKTYPTFMRVVPSDYFQAKAWATVASYFGWKRACILTSTEPVHVLIKDTFLTFVSSDFVSFVQSFPTGSNMTNQLLILKNSGCTIFYLACYFDDAAMVFFLASIVNLVGPNNAWIGTDSWMQPEFLQSITNTSILNVVQMAVRGAIGFTPSSGNNTETNIFINRIKMLGNFTSLDSYTTFAYDAVWTLGIGLHDMILKGYIPQPTIPFKKILLEYLKNTTFEGVTGKVSFEPNGDRIGPYDFKNFLPDGNLVTIGLYDPTIDTLTLYTDVIWKNGTKIPKDRPDNCNEIPISSPSHCEQTCQDTDTGPVCGCLAGWKINDDGRTCDKYPCILTPWSNWVVCTELCHYPKTTRTRSVNVTASQGSPICLDEVLSQNLGIYSQLDGMNALLVLQEEWDAWLPSQFQAIFGFNSTTLSISGKALLIQVTPSNDTFSCQLSSLNLSSSLQQWATLSLPEVDYQRYKFTFDGCSILMEINDVSPPNYTALLVSIPVTFIIVLIAGIVTFVLWIRNRHLDLSSLPEQIRKPLDHAQNHPIKYIKHSNVLYLRELREDSEGYKFVMNLLETKLDGKGIGLEKIMFGFNKILLSAFISKLKIMNTRVTTASVIFYKDTWKFRDPHKRRECIYKNFSEYMEEFKWNKDSDVPLVPMLHGTDEGSALKIFESGFAALAQVDKGYYGKGIYFTTSAKYALTYCGFKDKPTLILAYIIPGHIYPTIEHPNSEHSLVGMPIMAGYQSHFILINLDGMPANENYTGPTFTELVVDQEPQVLPSYLLVPNPVSAKKVLSKLDFQKEKFREKIEIDSDSELIGG